MMLAYEGARTGRRTEGWTVIGNSADAEISTARALLRDRARDLVRNNPHAAKGLAVIVSNKIGTGIMCAPAEARTDGRRPNLRKNQRLADRWKRWVDNCDLTGKGDLYAIQSLTERARAESGEALVRFVPTRPTGPQDVPFRLQVLEPDLIDSALNRVISETTLIRDGIEYENGIATAYWLFDAHPGDVGPVPLRRSFASSRVPASEILHYFKPLRAGQRRGVTDFAPVILRLRDADDYEDAELMRKKVAACLVAAITTPAGLPGASLGPITTDDKGRVESMYPGQLAYLKPGEAVTFNDPKPSGDYKDFMAVVLHAVAAGLNIPYELLTGDLSEVTYTSHRGGLVQFRGMIEADQWQVVVPQLCLPICRRFAREASGADSMIDPNVDWSFTPPRFGLLDPAKEVPAQIAAIQSGVMSYQTTVQREGYDWRETLDQIEEFQSECARRKIAVSSIPPAPQSAGTAPQDDDEEDAPDAEAA